MLRVYYADISGLDIRPAVSKLSEYRLKRLGGTDLAKKQGSGAELLLDHALRELDPERPLPPDIFADEFGKPHLRGGPCFSLSHSGCYSLCAVSDGEIGADIQEQRQFNERLAKRFFSEAELAHILAADDRDYAFSRIWALKESYIKALGKGLRMPLNSFSIHFENEICIEGLDWRFWHRCVDGYHVALCFKGVYEPEIFREIELRVNGY